MRAGRLVARKSVWRFLDLVLDELLEAPPATLVDLVSQTVSGVRNLAPLESGLRESLVRRSRQLGHSEQSHLRRIGREVEFMARTAPQPPA